MVKGLPRCQETPISAGFGNPPGSETFFWHDDMAIEFDWVPSSNFPKVPVSHCSNPGFGRRIVLLMGKDGKLQDPPGWTVKFGGCTKFQKHSFKCAGRSFRSKIFMFPS